MHSIFASGRLHACVHDRARGLCQARAGVCEKKRQADWTQCQRQRLPPSLDQGHRRDNRQQIEVPHYRRHGAQDRLAVRHDRLPGRLEHRRQGLAVDDPLCLHHRSRQEDPLDNDLSCQLRAKHRRGVEGRRLLADVREVEKKDHNPNQLGAGRRRHHCTQRLRQRSQGVVSEVQIHQALPTFDPAFERLVPAVNGDPAPCLCSRFNSLPYNSISVV